MILDLLRQSSREGPATKQKQKKGLRSHKHTIFSGPTPSPGMQLIVGVVFN